MLNRKHSCCNIKAKAKHFFPFSPRVEGTTEMPVGKASNCYISSFKQGSRMTLREHLYSHDTHVYGVYGVYSVPVIDESTNRSFLSSVDEDTGLQLHHV